MDNSRLRRNAVFLAGAVVAGAACAMLLSWLLPSREAPDRGEMPAGQQFALTASDEAGPTPVDPQSKATPAVSARAPVEPTAPARTRAATETPPGPGSYATAVQRSAPAVVSIYTQGTVQVAAGPPLRVSGRIVQPVRNEARTGLGSGVIVDAQGHIVTNDHVVRGADAINVQLADGRDAVARILGRDPETDLAVLKIDLKQLPVMTLGRSDRLAVGDVVLAIGNPLGLSQTVTLGIISFNGRALGSTVAKFEKFIQTDAAINAGNSGGALVNARGELIGINTAALEGANGLGLAIPVDLVRGVFSEILQHGQVMRGWIGIGLGELSERRAKEVNYPYWGVLVTEFDPRSPALKSGGLAYNDKIETIDGHPVSTEQETRARIANRKPGSTVTITGVRCATQPPTPCRSVQKFSTTLTVIEPPPLTR